MHWARYKQILRLTALAAIPLVLCALAGLYASAQGRSRSTSISPPRSGSAFGVLLSGALMGLVFLSSGTGHDEAVIDPLDDRAAR